MYAFLCSGEWNFLRISWLFRMLLYFSVSVSLPKLFGFPLFTHFQVIPTSYAIGMMLLYVHVHVMQSVHIFVSLSACVLSIHSDWNMCVHM